MIALVSLPLVRNLVKQIVSETNMKSLTFLIAFCLWALEAQSQRFISSQDLGAGEALSSRIFPWDQDQFLLLSYNRGQRVLIFTGSPNSRFSVPYSNAEMPNVRYHHQSYSFLNGRGWVGSIDKIHTATRFDSWTPVDIAEPGREIEVSSLTPISPSEAFATAASYIVTRIDSTGGVIGKWTEDYRGVVYHILGDQSRKIATLPPENSPISNAVRTADGAICVALRTDSELRYALAIIRLDGRIRYVEAPSGMPSFITPTFIVRTENSTIVAFYAGVTGGGDIPPSFLYYDEASGISSWHKLPRESYVSFAIAVGASKVLAHSLSSLLVLDRTTATQRDILHPTLNYTMNPLGLSHYGTDSVAVAFQEGLMLMPIQQLVPTSVQSDTKPGRVVRALSTSVSFEHIVDGSENVSWLLYDNNGRLVEQGLTEIGQTDLTVEFAGKPQGLYLLHLSAGNRRLILERMIYMD